MNNFQVLISVMLLCLFLNVSAQNNYEEVLYLKNGGVIRGVIIEQIPNQQIKIQTKDKNIFVFKYDEIDRITKDINSISTTSENDNQSENTSQEKKGDSTCENATLDAENYHGKKGLHFGLGVLFGPFAMIGTAISEPTPMKGKQTMSMSKNKSKFNDHSYLSCYKKKAKSQLIQMEAIGWGSWLLLLLIL
jgi:sRNA-binding regulator protein Hfq